MYGSAAHLLPYSEFTRRSLTDDYGISRENTTVLPPGIDLSFWNGNGRRNAKPAGAPFVALFVGDELRRKGGISSSGLPVDPRARQSSFTA